MAKISEAVWRQVLMEKVGKVQSTLRAAEQDRLYKLEQLKPKFLEAHKKDIKAILDMRKQLNDLTASLNSMESRVYQEAETVGFDVKEDTRYYKDRPYSGVSPEWEPILRTTSRDYDLFDSRYSPLDEQLAKTKIPELQKMYSDYRTLRLQLELSDNKEAMELVKKFLES